MSGVAGEGCGPEYAGISTLTPVFGRESWKGELLSVLFGFRVLPFLQFDRIWNSYGRCQCHMHHNEFGPTHPVA